MPLFHNDRVGRIIVRIGHVLGIGGAALAIVAALALIIAVVFFR